MGNVSLPRLVQFSLGCRHRLGSRLRLGVRWRVASSVEIQLHPRLIQFFLDHLNFSCEFRSLGPRAFAVFKQSAILLDPIVANCFQKFTLATRHESL
jgi:hypothetical protein